MSAGVRWLLGLCLWRSVSLAAAQTALPHGDTLLPVGFLGRGIALVQRGSPFFGAPASEEVRCQTHYARQCQHRCRRCRDESRGEPAVAACGALPGIAARLGGAGQRRAQGEPEQEASPPDRGRRVGCGHVL
ncbi:hypothetical protein CKO31_19675 [Thiohalocapsa halophila]|uniref:Uncharacterized protein n=1 Tax=Thiohalocapsa halophila TaxID=69359 RepID=A0ABS1CLX0_9GAMM|nr:hypothetical protein [Thiohalocapsa halophila]